MQRGEVKWFQSSKGFGIITPEEGGEDLFVHHTGIKSENKNLQEGQRVSFDVESYGAKGNKAVNVVVLERWE